MRKKDVSLIRSVGAAKRMALMIRIMLDHPSYLTVRDLCGFIEDETGKEPVFSTVWRDIYELERHKLARRRPAVHAREGTRIELLLKRAK